MRIGFVLDDSLDKTDGVQQYILTLGHWLSTEGHTIHYLVGETKRGDLPRVHSLSKNLRAHFNQNRVSTPLPASKAKIRQLLKRYTFDVLHVQMPYSPLLAGRVIKAAPATTAVIGTFHIIPFSQLERWATRLLRVFVRRSLKRFDTVYSVSVPAQKFAKRSFKVMSQVLPNVVALQHFQNGRKPRRYADDKLTIVFLGRLVERKGCLHLLKALALLQQKGQLSRVRVLICGKGPLRPQLEKYVRQHKLASVVRFVGYISEDDKPDYLASADIAVFPSTGGESFGIVLIEAMAAGAKVVLAGKNRGYEAVMGRRKDQLIKPTDTVAFAKRLQHFMENFRARKQATAWQAEAVEQYDVRRVGRQLMDTYTSVASKRQKP